MTLIDSRPRVQQAGTGSGAVTRLGFWSALVALVAAVLYSLAQIVSPPLIPLLAFPWSDVLIIAPSLVIPLALVVALHCLDARTTGERSVWSRTAVSFATMYGVLVGAVYIVQLAAVIPARIRGHGADVAVVALSAPWVQAVDALGYGLMSVAFLCAARAVSPHGPGRAARWAFLAHGLLAPFVVLPLWLPPFLAVGALWFVTGPAALFCLMRLFQHDRAASGRAEGLPAGRLDR
jgi:hypothetical protein